MTDKHTQPLEPTVTAGESDLVCFGTTATYALQPITTIEIADLIADLRDISANDGNATMDTREVCGRAATALDALQAEVATLKRPQFEIMEQAKEAALIGVKFGNEQSARADAAEAENERLRSLVYGEKPGTRAVPIGSEVEQARAKRAALKEPTT